MLVDAADNERAARSGCTTDGAVAARQAERAPASLRPRQHTSEDFQRLLGDHSGFVGRRARASAFVPAWQERGCVYQDQAPKQTETQIIPNVYDTNTVAARREYPSLTTTGSAPAPACPDAPACHRNSLGRPRSGAANGLARAGKTSPPPAAPSSKNHCLHITPWSDCPGSRTRCVESA